MRNFIFGKVYPFRKCLVSMLAPENEFASAQKSDNSQPLIIDMSEFDARQATMDLYQSMSEYTAEKAKCRKNGGRYDESIYECDMSLVVNARAGEGSETVALAVQSDLETAAAQISVSRQMKSCAYNPDTLEWAVGDGCNINDEYKSSERCRGQEKNGDVSKFCSNVAAYGVSKCGKNDLRYNSPGEEGDVCWCRMTWPYFGEWASLGNDCGTGFGASGRAYCAGVCAAFVRSGQDYFRSKVFAKVETHNNYPSAAPPVPTPPHPTNADGSCKNDGYYVEDGQCRPKIFNIVLHTKIPGIPKSMQCVWNDKMLENGIHGDNFNDGCAMPLIIYPEEFGLSQFARCDWFDMDDYGISSQQRIVNFFYDPNDGPNDNLIITGKEHTFNIKSTCRTRGGQSMDFY